MLMRKISGAEGGSAPVGAGAQDDLGIRCHTHSCWLGDRTEGMFWLVTALQSLAFLHSSSKGRVTRERTVEMIGDSRSIGGGRVLKPSVTDAERRRWWQLSSGCLKQAWRELGGRERHKDTWQGTEERRVSAGPGGLCGTGSPRLTTCLFNDRADSPRGLPFLRLRESREPPFAVLVSFPQSVSVHYIEDVAVTQRYVFRL